MQHSHKITCLGGAGAALLLVGACQPVNLPPPVAREPERLEARIGGPERVFERPVAELVPALQGARASGPDGRVGPELVFWGYELASGGQASLVACAVLPNVDCAARTAKVCERGTRTVLFSGEEGGEVRYRNCQAVGIAQPGDLTPNCVETEQTQPILLNLLSCN